MSHVLSPTKQQQVLALGQLGWSLRRIEAATGVRRETISGYLQAAGIPVRRRGGRVGQWPPPNPATTAGGSTDSSDGVPPNPATTAGVSTDLAPGDLDEPPACRPSLSAPGRAPTASVCAPYHDVILEGLRRGRNARAI